MVIWNETSMSKLKLGVLGLGEGRSIISAALASQYWELVQLCDLRVALHEHLQCLLRAPQVLHLSLLAVHGVGHKLVPASRLSLLV